MASCVRDAIVMVGDSDLLVSDISLPDGSGYDLMREVRSRRHIPAIALSGYGSREHAKLCEDVGFERLLFKPVNPRDLLQAIEQIDPDH